MTRAAVLLAAGASRRFGPSDKLLAPLGNKPLVTHAADALRASDLDVLIAVVRSKEVAALLAGFETVIPDKADPKQSASLRAGVLKARDLGATQITVVLGDMPFVSASMIDVVTQECTETRPAAAWDGTRPIPPVCFPNVFFDDLLALHGDRGAASLLSDAVFISASGHALHDIDTRDALTQAAQKLD
ncbi:MAG: nucleotidyltransferase family protein [Pseudomonadota bacterium]